MNVYGQLLRKSVAPQDSVAKRSYLGPHGGNNPYHQLQMNNEFSVLDNRIGHTQARNQMPVVIKRSYELPTKIG